MPATEPGDTPFVSVIMPVFRSAPGLLSDALEALWLLDYPRERREVLVVDNDLDGQGQLEQVVARHQPAARYLRSPRRGAHSARNYGLLQARGEYCYFVDDDVLVEPGCARALVRALADESVGAAGGRIRPLWRDAAPPEWIDLFHDSSFVVRESYRRVLVDAGVSEGDRRLNLGLLSLLDLGDRGLDVDENWLYSCHLMVKRAAALAAGGFGPDLVGHYLLGDNEMGLLRRMAASGLRLRYEPEAVVSHVIRASRLSMRYLARRTRNDGTCDAYIRLRAGEVRGPLAVVREALTHLARALLAAGPLAFRALRRNPRWRLAFTEACTELGASHYYAMYLLSPRRRELVHSPNYLDALARAG